ncbi:MAG: hypothetical protein IKO49_07400 [Bacilli bacterium]|nr:hypothetical protein [Bacilli bacterium]
MMDNKENFTIQDFIIQLEQINYLEILDAIKPLIIYYVTSKAIDTYKLHRDYKPKNISKVTLPPELTSEYSEIDINKIVATKYGESIVKFADVVINNFSSEDLTNFYNNINDLKTRSKKFGIQNLILRSKTAGQYDPKKNEITIDDDTAETTIYHELFHMASSTYKDGIRYSGFQQASLKSGVVSLGKGLNEGYTELLSQRYFTPDSSVTGTYEYQVFIAEKLEQIIGKEKLQSLYLNSNLKGLIDELKQYVSEEEIMKFISNTDFLINHMDDKKLQLFEKNMIGNCLKSINRFVIICYSKKLQQQVKNGEISSNDEILQKLTEYISSLASNIKIRKRRYEVMTDEDIQESLQASFENTNVTVSINREEQSDIKR